MEILPHEKPIYEYEETIKQVEEQNKNGLKMRLIK